MAHKFQTLRQSLTELLVPFPRYTHAIKCPINSYHAIKHSTAAFLDELGTGFGLRCNEFGDCGEGVEVFAGWSAIEDKRLVNGPNGNGNELGKMERSMEGLLVNGSQEEDAGLG